MLLLPKGKAQAALLPPALDAPELQEQFVYLIHVVWMCERWWSFEDHVDQLIAEVRP